MTRVEILKLHELPEEEQLQWLYNRDLLDCYHCCDTDDLYESLADLAFRLRDEWISVNGVGDWTERLYDYMKATGTAMPISGLKPIHWIQTALSARLEKQ